MSYGFLSQLRSAAAAAIMAFGAMTLAQEPSPVDLPNGFSSQSHGATRLTDIQARQLKPIGAAPLEQFYPREAKASGQAGKALLDLLVDASGAVA